MSNKNRSFASTSPVSTHDDMGLFWMHPLSNASKIIKIDSLIE